MASPFGNTITISAKLCTWNEDTQDYQSEGYPNALDSYRLACAGFDPESIANVVTLYVTGQKPNHTDQAVIEYHQTGSDLWEESIENGAYYGGTDETPGDCPSNIACRTDFINAYGGVPTIEIQGFPGYGRPVGFTGGFILETSFGRLVVPWENADLGYFLHPTNNSAWFISPTDLIGGTYHGLQIDYYPVFEGFDNLDSYIYTSENGITFSLSEIAPQRNNEDVPDATPYVTISSWTSGAHSLEAVQTPRSNNATLPPHHGFGEEHGFKPSFGFRPEFGFRSELGF